MKGFITRSFVTRDQTIIRKHFLTKLSPFLSYLLPESDKKV